MAKQSMHRVYWSLVCTCAVEGYMMDMLDKGRWRWNCQAGGKNRGRPQRRFMAVFKEDIQRRMLGIEWGGGMKKSPCTAFISGRDGHKDPNHLLYQTTNLYLFLGMGANSLLMTASSGHLWKCTYFPAACSWHTIQTTTNHKKKKNSSKQTVPTHPRHARPLVLLHSATAVTHLSS